MVARANNRHLGEGVGREEGFEGPKNPVQDGWYVDEEFFVLDVRNFVRIWQKC
jgi:hypothetical protein